MKLFKKSPKAHKFYKDALDYLVNHGINYTTMPNRKMFCYISIENVETKKINHITLRIYKSKLYATIKNFINKATDYEKQIEEFEDFTSIIYHLRFDQNENL